MFISNCETICRFIHLSLKYYLPKIIIIRNVQLESMLSITEPIEGDSVVAVHSRRDTQNDQPYDRGSSCVLSAHISLVLMWFFNMTIYAESIFAQSYCTIYLDHRCSVRKPIIYLSSSCTNVAALSHWYIYIYTTSKWTYQFFVQALTILLMFDLDLSQIEWQHLLHFSTWSRWIRSVSWKLTIWRVFIISITCNTFHHWLCRKPHRTSIQLIRLQCVSVMVLRVNYNGSELSKKRCYTRHQPQPFI